MGRGLKALAVSLAVGLGMTACSRDYVEGYLYTTNSGSALITAYAIDYQSGALTQLADSPISENGAANADPVTLVASPNGQNLYVINNFSDTIVEFAIGTDGKLYGENTYNVVQGNGLTGTFPTAAAIDPAGKFLYVTFQYQNGYTTVRPGPGGLATFPINADGSLGTALTNTTIGTTAATPLPYIPLGNNPVGVAIPKTGGFVYVIDQETSPSAHGVMISFCENTTTGVLSNVGSSPCGTGTPPAAENTVAAGTQPTAIAEDPSGHFIYVTDGATNQLYAYSLTGGGAPLALLNSPFATGLLPDAVTVDPRGTFVYVANYASSTISSYTINTATGALSGTGGNTSVATGPTCVTIDPALGIYLYTSNKVDSSISAEQLDPHSGALTSVQGTQFTTQQLPTCVVAVTNGAHATQIVE